MKATASPRFDAIAIAIGIACACYALALASTPLLVAPERALLKSLVLAPIIEETFFRGFIQARLRASSGFIGQAWVAIVVTAIAFGLFHLPHSSAVHAALVVAPACVLGWVYERTRSVALCIGLHSLANAIWISFWSL